MPGDITAGLCLGGAWWCGRSLRRALPLFCLRLDLCQGSVACFWRARAFCRPCPASVQMPGARLGGSCKAQLGDPCPRRHGALGPCVCLRGSSELIQSLALKPARGRPQKCPLRSELSTGAHSPSLSIPRALEQAANSCSESPDTCWSQQRLPHGSLPASLYQYRGSARTALGSQLRAVCSQDVIPAPSLPTEL